MMEFGLPIAAFGLWLLFRWRSRHRWSPHGRRNRPIRWLSPLIVCKNSFESHLLVEAQPGYSEMSDPQAGEANERTSPS